MSDQEQIEQDIWDALDRVVNGSATKDDAALLAWAIGWTWVPKKERNAA